MNRAADDPSLNKSRYYILDAVYPSEENVLSAIRKLIFLEYATSDATMPPNECP